jgi:cysteinyl-tRNA synthetase
LYADTLFGIGLTKPDERVSQLLKKAFGEDVASDVLPPDIQKLVADRDEARAQKDWARSDSIRDELAGLGYEVTDSAQGTKIAKH